VLMDNQRRKWTNCVWNPHIEQATTHLRPHLEYVNPGELSLPSL